MRGTGMDTGRGLSLGLGGEKESDESLLDVDRRGGSVVSNE